MQLPFTTEQFFDLLAAYNVALWPALAVLWMASLISSLLLFSSRGPSDRWISGLLAAHWIWSALAYHAAFFTRIDSAAWVFAALSAICWTGVQSNRIPFRRWVTNNQLCH
jgi:hypothetical protein